MTELTYHSTTAIVAPDPSNAADWGQAAVDWLANMTSERTRRAYREAWRDFMVFTGKTPDQVNQSDVIAFKVDLKTNPSPKTGKLYSQSTINQRLSALSSFYTFAADRGLVERNPVDGVKREAVSPYGKATWLDPEEDEDLEFLSAIDTSTTKGKRDRAIMLLMLTGAFRVNEVASLKVGDIRRHGNGAFVTYTRKGGTSEEVPLAAQAVLAIDAYLADRDGLNATSPLFVATEQGRNLAARLGHDVADDKPLTTRAIRYLVQSYGNQVFGRGHGIRPHSLRHTAAQVAIHEGLSVTEVSRLLKHGSLAVTTIYMHATNKSDKKAAAVMGGRYATT